MSRSRDERELTKAFARDYLRARTTIMRELERAACGCDYGGTSWTTRSEADHVGRLLRLGPGHRLLDVGAGSGWPGLYLAATTGCDLALVDVPLEGLRIADERAANDRLVGECWVAVADGAALPFRDGWFDGVSHSDVLCCLEAKQSVLSACRRVVRRDGRMVFTVISIASGLSSTDHRRAVEFGPPYVKALAGYPELLRRTGWETTFHADLSAEFGETVERVLRGEEARSDELSDFFGETEFAERMARKRNTIQAIEDGLIRRELFVATPAARSPSATRTR